MALKTKDSGIGMYPSLLEDIKKRVRRAQIGATLAANADIDLRIWYMEQCIRNGWSRDDRRVF